MTLSQQFARQSTYYKTEAVHFLDALAAIATSADERLHPVEKEPAVTKSLSIFELLDFTPINENEVSNRTTPTHASVFRAERINQIVAQQATIMRSRNTQDESLNSAVSWHFKVVLLEKNLNNSEGLKFQDKGERAEYLAKVADCFNEQFGELEISGANRIRMLESHPFAFVNSETNEIEVIRKWEAAKSFATQNSNLHTSCSSGRDKFLSLASLLNKHQQEE